MINIIFSSKYISTVKKYILRLKQINDEFLL